MDIFKGKNTVNFHDESTSDPESIPNSTVPDFIKVKCRNGKVLESNDGDDHDDGRYFDTRAVLIDIDGIPVRCNMSFDHDQVTCTTFVNYSLMKPTNKSI